VDKAAETELEQDAREMRSAEGGATGALLRGEEGSALEAGAKSIENVKGGEMLMEALDLVEAELPNYELEDAPHGCDSKQHRNPLLLGLTPYKYLLRALRSVKAPDLEQALLVLPFHYVCRLIRSLIEVSCA
jgi:U3 small nucleolar RNA-associated protein 12